MRNLNFKARQAYLANSFLRYTLVSRSWGENIVEIKYLLRCRSASGAKRLTYLGAAHTQSSMKMGSPICCLHHHGNY
uniref:Uncharacterized protein MANES_17G097200 n=1 Tax=Rhizophora mucronata TaxID=61149 RepID=A0A2P2M0Z7_RHIMU